MGENKLLDMKIIKLSKEKGDNKVKTKSFKLLLMLGKLEPYSFNHLNLL